MLQHPHPVQVSGDKLAGFYRRGAADDPEMPEHRERRLEAYSWGRLTAGASARALWLLLLPFALVNVASWAHPVRPTPKFAPVGWMSGLLRVFALSITAMLVLGTASISMDLLAWQCGNDVPRCASEHWFTSFMESGWAGPGVRIAIGALVPLLLVEGLRRLSKSTGRAYEEYEEHLPDTDPDTGTTGTAAGTGTGTVAYASSGDPLPADGGGTASCGARDFARPGFWSGGRPLRRLRSLHTGSAFATVAALVAYATRHGGHAKPVGSVLLALALVVVVSAVLLALSPYSGRRRELFEGQSPPRWACLAMDAVQWAGVALALASLAYAVGYDTPPGPDAGIVPGLHKATDVLTVTQMVVLALLTAATIWALLPYRRTASQSLMGRPMFFGFAAPTLAFLSLAVTSTYVSGVSLRVADYLGTPVVSSCLPACPQVTDRSNTLFGVPPQRYWAGRAFAVAVAATLLVGVVLLVRRKARAAGYRAKVRAEYGIPSGDDERVATIAKAQQAAGMTDRADLAVMAILMITIVGQDALWLWRDTMDPQVLEAITTFGTWLVSFSALGIVALGRSAYRNEGLRRTVGIVWDLATFWPRAAHPFAPPCYCERTVPELRRRIGRLHDAGGKVVVSAHSQGTVIAAATMLQLPPEDRGRVGLLTYGCPLDRLYARAFPHYFGKDSLRDVDAAVANRWRNLFRRTDPIGGPVFVPDQPVLPPTGHDRRLTDPGFAKDSYEFTWPRARAHSDYPHDPRFEQTVTEVAGLL
jgi:hypothetical protein